MAENNQDKPEEKTKVVDMYHKEISESSPRIKINNNSNYESARRSLKFQRELWRGRGAKVMTREEEMHKLSQQEYKMAREDFLKTASKNAGSSKQEKTEEKSMAEKKRSRAGFKIGAEQVLEKLVEYTKELGRFPTHNEIKDRSKKEPDFPGSSTVYRKLGDNWRDKVEKALNEGEIKKPQNSVTQSSKKVKSPIEAEVKPKASNFSSSDDSTKVIKRISEYLDWICNMPETSSSIDSKASFKLCPSKDLVIEIDVHAMKGN